MLVFLDTEFTDLLNPELLSLGLVTLDGREHYAELDLTTDAGKARAKASSAFVQSGIFHMWGLVPGATGTEWEMGRRTGEWLIGLAAESGTKVEVAFDYSTDYELMEYAIRDSGLWDQVREVVLPVNVNPITGTITGELAAEECFRALGQRGGRGLKRHHALADALVLVEIAGLRIAGLGGVFRGKVWAPPAPATFENPKQYLARCGKGNFWRGGLPLTHRSTIFPVDYERLQKQRADILVTHEAPSSHPHGFAAIDELARRLGVSTSFHGHHHDQLDYSLERARLGFNAFGVGFRGIIDQDGQTKTENVIWKSLFGTSPE